MLAFAFTWRESKRTLETAGYDFPMSAVLRKREKQAIIEEQEKQANMARLEPVTRQLELTEKLSNEEDKHMTVNEEPDGGAYRRFRDPRLGGAIFHDP
ncbi:unnamed protein product [Mesocestoides corti]|nr:unnamed protein product [Mesocestoides corti]